jgi:PAS domain S-box-containing protein
MGGRSFESSARRKVENTGGVDEEKRARGEGQALLQSLYDRSPLFIGVSELRGDEVVLVDCNVATARSVNATPADLRGRRVTELGVSSDIERLWAQRARLSRAQDTPVRFEYHYPLQGPDAWVASTVTFLGESSHGRPRFGFVSEDITELKRTEVALRESEERYRSLFDNMTEGFILGELIYDYEGKPCDFVHLAANPAAETHSGMKASEVVGKTVRELSPSIDAHLFEILGDVVSTGKPARYEIYIQDTDRYYECLAYRTGMRRFASHYRDVTERNRAEEALRESEERFSKAFRLNPAAMAITQLSDGRFIDVNESWERLSGWSRSETIGRTSIDLGFFKDQAAREAIIGRLRVGESIRGLALRFSLRSGEQRDVLLSTDCIDFRGMRCVLGTAQDISAHKRAEAKVRESEEEFRAAFETSSMGMCQADPLTLRYLRVNRRFCEMSGYSEAELLGMRFSDTTHPDDLPRNLAGFQRMVRGETKEFRAEKRFIRKDGSIMWIDVTVNVVHSSEGQPKRTVAIVQDISERLRAEEQRAFQAGLLGQVHDGVMAVDENGRITYWNKGAEEILGWPASEALGLASGDLLTRRIESSSPYEPPSKLLATDGYEGEVRQRRRDGSYVTVDVRSAALHGPGGELRGIINTIRDVSERKQAQEAREAERRKDEFMAVLSHELRNPLGAIRNSLFVLKRAPAGSDQSKRCEEVIDRQITHLTRLVDDLLDVTRVARGKVQLKCDRVELATLVKRTIDDHRATFVANGIDLRARTSVAPIWITADATRIEQVVGNLLGNAAKFTPRGGRVEVVLEMEGPNAKLGVRDNGVGIDPAVVDCLFQPFTQAAQTLDRSRGGLGLGLALVKGLVELHGGSVDVASEGPGHGAEFTVRLPLSAAIAETQAVTPRPSAQRRRVLVIEDNIDAANSLKAALEFAGHDVEVAYDGPSGLARARACRPEVVLCDVGLPGISGYEVALAFAADDELRDCVLIALTGYGLPEDKERAISAGFARHVTKPLTLEALEEVLGSAGVA